MLAMKMEEFLHCATLNLGYYEKGRVPKTLYF